VADHAEQFAVCALGVPSDVQKLSGYIVLFLPDANLGKKGVPLCITHIEIFAKGHSIFPNIFEQQLSHILCHVLY
jgi:hypothetical protein